jgi:galactokinase
MIVTLADFHAALPEVRHRVSALTQAYTEYYGEAPRVVVSAPGRTEIIGNHTDHNNGRVVAAAVTLDTLVVAGPAAGGSDDSSLRLLSDGWEREFSVDSDRDLHRDAHATERLMAGVAAGLEKAGFSAPGYRACMDSTVLPGSGLSSSAALEIALTGIHGVLSDTEIPPLEAARVGRFAEHQYMGKPSGLMDQLASALGGMNAIDFADPQSPRIHRVEVNFTSSNHHLLVVHTGGSHADLTAEYGAISEEMHAVARRLGVENLAETNRKQLLRNLSALRSAVGDRAVLRALHFYDEQERVSAFVDATTSRLNERAFELMTESGDSSIRLLQNAHSETSNHDQALALGLELTRLFLRQRGGTGAYRVHGGGFAGTMLVVVPESLFEEYRTAMGRAFGEEAVVPLQIRQDGLVAARLEPVEPLEP